MNLIRYVPSGTIFARFKIGGKQVRKSLKTSNLELARNKWAEVERSERAITKIGRGLNRSWCRRDKWGRRNCLRQIRPRF